MNTDYPLKIRNENNKEILYYNYKDLEEGKMYIITWDDDNWALKKENGLIKFYTLDLEASESEL